MHAGVMGNTLLPDWLQTALLTLLLLVVVWKTAGKARKQTAIEAENRCVRFGAAASEPL